jgi:hypothetical protein
MVNILEGGFIRVNILEGGFIREPWVPLKN